MPLAVQAKAPARANTALTGSYHQGNYGTLDVQALPGRKVRFHFEGLFNLHAPGGPNLGEAEGVLRLHKNTAVYASPYGKGRLTLRFAPRRVVIMQVGDSADMGFGQGVNATGVYKKTSRRVPKFTERDH